MKPEIIYEYDSIGDALLGARLLRPYYARAIGALRPVKASDTGGLVVSRDWRVFYDPTWLASLSPAQQAGEIAAHAVEHLLRDHARRGDRICLDDDDRARWNVAACCEIGDDAGDAQLSPDAHTPTGHGLQDGDIAERYFDDVQGDGHTCGSGAGGVVLPSEGGDDGQGLDRDAADALREMVAQDVRQYAAANGRGSLPVGVAIWAETLCPPIVAVSWSSLLANVLARVSREVTAGRADYSYARQSRRQREGAPLRPATVAYRPTVACVVDTSGSMASAGEAAIGVVRGLARMVGTVQVYQCDAAVQAITRGMPRIWRGGGGTDLPVAIQVAADAACDAIVVVTDGDTPWGDAPPCPVIAVFVGASDRAIDAAPNWLRAKISIDT